MWLSTWWRLVDDEQKNWFGSNLRVICLLSCLNDWASDVWLACFGTLWNSMGAFLYQLANDASSFNPHLNVKASKSEFCLVSSELACFDKKNWIHWNTLGPEKWATKVFRVDHGDCKLFTCANFHPRKENITQTLFIYLFIFQIEGTNNFPHSCCLSLAVDSVSQWKFAICSGASCELQ